MPMAMGSFQSAVAEANVTFDTSAGHTHDGVDSKAAFGALKAIASAADTVEQSTAASEDKRKITFTAGSTSNVLTALKIVVDLKRTPTSTCSFNIGIGSFTGSAVWTTPQLTSTNTSYETKTGYVMIGSDATTYDAKAGQATYTFTTHLYSSASDWVYYKNLTITAYALDAAGGSFGSWADA